VSRRSRAWSDSLTWVRVSAQGAGVAVGCSRATVAFMSMSAFLDDGLED
jgi:hypothetical protein